MFLVYFYCNEPYASFRLYYEKLIDAYLLIHEIKNEISLFEIFSDGTLMFRVSKTFKFHEQIDKIGNIVLNDLIKNKIIDETTIQIIESLKNPNSAFFDVYWKLGLKYEKDCKFDLSLKLYQKGFVRCNLPSIRFLALSYYDGIGTKANRTLAINLMKLSSALGDKASQNCLRFLKNDF